MRLKTHITNIASILLLAAVSVLFVLWVFWASDLARERTCKDFMSRGFVFYGCREFIIPRYTAVPVTEPIIWTESYSCTSDPIPP